MTETSQLDIAIIGMSGRFPGASTLDRFWHNLTEGVESIRFFSEDELRSSGVDAALFANPNYVPARAVLDDAECFDAEFFGFTSEEAETANPQQRLFLECAWEALERAGYPPSTHDLAIGVFATAGTNAYADHCQTLVRGGAISAFQVGLGNDREHLASRVAYKLNLRGPSLVVQTACSSSLVAVHLACQSLLAGDCDAALAGGAYVTVPPKSGYLFEEGNMYSRDGHCRPFDASASGTVRGDGTGVVVLKRLTDARAANDHILAVIKGSAVNNDGSSKVGYTAPGVAGQVAVIGAAQTAAGIGAETIGYVECHGTGTILGDAVEMAALAKAFAAAPARNGRCLVGSVKSNIGHLDVAGGVAGLIKTVLIVQHGLIPPSLHFVEPNPNIDFAGSAFRVATAVEAWPSNGTPRRAAVNSFGLGGTNAHVILEQAPPPAIVPRATSAFLLPVSAPTPAALERVTALLRDRLRSGDAVDLGDVAYTLQRGRKHFACRRAVVCRDGDHAGACESLANPGPMIADARGCCHSVAFVFPGVGELPGDLGRDIYGSHEVCRDTVDRLSVRLIDDLGIDLRRVMSSPGEQAADLERRRGRADIGEALVFVLDLALARLWMHWGLRPAAMIGCGVGEYVAATLAEVVSLDDALVLLSARLRFARQPGRDGARLDAGCETFRSEIAAASFRPPRIPYVSSVTGTWVEAADVTAPDYWARQARAAVEYGPGIGVAAEGVAVLLEVGPANGLARSARTRPDTPPLLLTSLPDGAGSTRAAEHLLKVAGSAWSMGIDVDWRAIGAPAAGRRVPLPTFPFERRRYWPRPGRSRE